MSKVGVDTPVSDLIGVSEGIAGDLPADAHVIELLLGCPEAGLDVPQAFPIGQLGKGHAEILIPTREALDFVVAVVSLDTLAKIVYGQEVHQLREDCTTNVHQPSPSADLQKYGI